MSPTIRAWFLFAAVIAVVLAGTKFGLDRWRESAKAPAVATEDAEKPKFFNSDHLMEMLARGGITATWGGDLLMRGDMLPKGSADKLAHVFLIHVKQPLTDQEAATAAGIAVRFFSNPDEWRVPWRYEGLAFQPADRDGKMRLVPIEDATLPTEINTDDANYDRYLSVVSDLIERDDLKRDEKTLPDKETARLAALQQKYPRDRIFRIDREPVMPFMPSAVTYVDGNGFYRRIILNQPLPVLERRLRAAEAEVRNADAKGAAYWGEAPDFGRGGVIFNEISKTDDGADTLGPQIGPILGSEHGNVLDRIWEAVQALPVKQRALIVRRKLINANAGPFNSFKLRFDADGTGARDVAVTVLSPLHKYVASPALPDPSGGPSIRLIFLNGFVKYIVSNFTVTVAEPNDLNVELSSTTYRNPAGDMTGFLSMSESDRDAFFKTGNPLLITKTTDFSYTGGETDVDPYRLIARKIVIDYINGLVRLATCGLFERPVEIASKESIVRYFFNDRGVPVRQESHVNKTGRLFGDSNDPDQLQLERGLASLSLTPKKQKGAGDTRDIFNFVICASRLL